MNGKCWGLPPTCPPDGKFSQCATGPGGGVDECVSKCAAIKDERLYTADNNCPK